MDMRLYEPRDRFACLGIFDSLAPASPDRPAREEFETWLRQPEGPYFVMDHEGSVVGCGGYELSPDRTTATLRWGMIGGSFQRMGLGRFLLMYRIREIGKVGTVGLVLARCPPLVRGFFEKQGFRPNGFDATEMVKKLTVCA